MGLGVGLGLGLGRTWYGSVLPFMMPQKKTSEPNLGGGGPAASTALSTSMEARPHAVKSTSSFEKRPRYIVAKGSLRCRNVGLGLGVG